MRYGVLDMRCKGLKQKAESTKLFLSYVAVGVSNLKSQTSNLK